MQKDKFMTEIWDLVDENGKELGIKWARADHDKLPDGVYHPCVEIWVRVGDRLLITQRHPNKSEGLKYDVPGGAVVSGESLLLGAQRELYEEVGIEASENELQRLGTIATGKVYAASYLITLDALPLLSLQPSEVVGYKLVTMEELDSMEERLTRGTYKRYLVYRERIFA